MVYRLTGEFLRMILYPIVPTSNAENNDLGFSEPFCQCLLRRKWIGALALMSGESSPSSKEERNFFLTWCFIYKFSLLRQLITGLVRQTLPKGLCVMKALGVGTHQLISQGVEKCSASDLAPLVINPSQSLGSLSSLLLTPIFKSSPPLPVLVTHPFSWICFANMHVIYILSWETIF